MVAHSCMLVINSIAQSGIIRNGNNVDKIYKFTVNCIVLITHTVCGLHLVPTIIIFINSLSSLLKLNSAIVIKFVLFTTPKEDNGRGRYGYVN